ncbi:MAG: serine/threonine-protein kinase [Deltaproteobacteria bacterium]
MTLNPTSPFLLVKADEAQPFPGRLAAGSRFGQYTIRACIGEGGMARVYSAEHDGLKRPVALKVLIDEHGSEQGAHQRFSREACLAAAIKHPNVVNIFDIGVHQGTPYLVMELLEGVDLEAFVRARGRLDEATITDILVPIAAGLAAVHDAGIVHRDLKPSNIFLARGRDEEVEPRLLDFGISKSLGADDLKLTAARGLLIGTPFYMAPEGVNGGEMTPLSDQYALGVVLYECATGINPFAEASSFSDVIQRVGLGQLPAVTSQNPELSPRLVAIIERAMQLDPARRFPDVRALGRELLSLASQRTRVTWSLSFTVLSARDAQTRTPAASSAPSASEAPRSKRSRAVRLLPWVALAALSLGWASSRTAPAPESSPTSNAAGASAIQAAPPIETASPARVPDRASAPTEQVLMLTPKPGSIRPTESVRAEPPPARPASPPRPRVAPAVGPAAAPAEAQPRRVTTFGTNRAPIFD